MGRNKRNNGRRKERERKARKRRGKKSVKKYVRGRTTGIEKWIKGKIQEKVIKEGKLTNELIFR